MAHYKFLESKLAKKDVMNATDTLLGIRKTESTDFTGGGGYDASVKQSIAASTAEADAFQSILNQFV